MAANDGQLKLKFLMYKRFFNAITGNGINIFDGGGGVQGDAGSA